MENREMRILIGGCKEADCCCDTSNEYFADGIGNMNRLIHVPYGEGWANQYWDQNGDKTIPYDVEIYP